MITRRRELLTCLLVLCLANSPHTSWGQEKLPDEKKTTSNSAENARAQREIEEYGKVLSPEERAKEEEKRINEFLECPGCTAEQRRDGEIVAASIRAAKAKNAEEIANAAVSNALLKPTIDTFLIAPTTFAEYIRIFGANESNPQDLTMAQSAEIRRIRRQMQTDFGQAAGNRDLNSKTFSRTIANSQSSFILILGHNDEGSFRFLDGTNALLDDLVTASKPNQRMI